MKFVEYGLTNEHVYTIGIIHMYKLVSLVVSLVIVQDEVAGEAATGKMYRSNYSDKHGRPVIVMRPNRQVSSETCFFLCICSISNFQLHF